MKYIGNKQLKWYSAETSHCRWRNRIVRTTMAPSEDIRRIAEKTNLF